MKAMLIDPVKRGVSGIEVELSTLSAAFHPRNAVVKVALTMRRLDNHHLLIHDRSACRANKTFIMDNVGPIHGRGLLLGYRLDGKGPVSALFTVRQVERLVRFM
jgi:hypothetical protein